MFLGSCRQLMRYKKSVKYLQHRINRRPVAHPCGLRETKLFSLNIPRDLGHALSGKHFVNHTHDLSTKDNIQEAEVLRGHKERDLYQDHTYHSQWIDRGMDGKNELKLVNLYYWMEPGYTIEPWVWYPGDQVEVVRGEFSGQRGMILAVMKHKNEIAVQGVNVQGVTIPASENRPEQIIQREHFISLHHVRHIDPTTRQPCDLKIISIRNKETGAVEKTRVSLQSGTLLPIPVQKEEAGTDPIRDTQLADAEEVTFDESEIDLLVSSKLTALEKDFVDHLKEGYQYHSKFQEKNYHAMLRYQRAVTTEARQMFLQQLRKQA